MILIVYVQRRHPDSKLNRARLGSITIYKIQIINGQPSIFPHHKAGINHTTTTPILTSMSTHAHEEGRNEVIVSKPKRKVGVSQDENAKYNRRYQTKTQTRMIHCTVVHP